MKLNESFKKGFLTPNMWAIRPSLTLSKWNTHTQYPIIRNGHIRHVAEISGNFKKPLFKVSNLRNALKWLKNAHWSPFLT